MKTYKETIIPERTYQSHVGTTCDLCGKMTDRNWKEDCYDAVDVEVRLKTGSSYPEGGGGEETTTDICPKCFLNKLLPWVKSQGGIPTTTEWER